MGLPPLPKLSRESVVVPLSPASKVEVAGGAGLDLMIERRKHQ